MSVCVFFPAANYSATSAEEIFNKSSSMQNPQHNHIFMPRSPQNRKNTEGREISAPRCEIGFEGGEYDANVSQLLPAVAASCAIQQASAARINLSVAAAAATIPAGATQCALCRCAAQASIFRS